MQLVKYRIAMYVNIIGWRLVGYISKAMVNVNNWCTQEDTQLEHRQIADSIKALMVEHLPITMGAI